MFKTAFMFPGQGAQYTGMAEDFYHEFQICHDTFDQASEVVGLDIAKLCFEKDERLDITEYTQIAMLTAELAIFNAVTQMGHRPDVTLGLSLGEYGAVVTAGALSQEDAFHIVRKRGIFMANEVPAGLGGMTAVLGMQAEEILPILDKVDGKVQIANYNCPGQIVISGEKTAVMQAGEALSQAGVRRVIPLNVSGPFHSELLAGAGVKLAQELQNITIHNIAIPYLANVTAEYVRDKNDIKELLTRQVSSSVKFEQSIRKLIADGVTTFVEIGPGKTLSGFVKKISREVEILSIEKVEDMKKLENR